MQVDRPAGLPHAGRGGAHRRNAAAPESITCTSVTPRTLRSKTRPRLLAEAAGPAALRLVGEDVEAARDIGRRLLAALVVRQELGIERAGDRRLLDDAAVVARMQAVEDLADLPRLVDDGAEVRPGALLAVGERQHRLVEPALDQIILERRARPSDTAPTCRA